MKTERFSSCALLACFVIVAACSQSSGLSRQYTPSANIVHHRVASPLSYGVLYSFGAAPDGSRPGAALINVGGTLYGTTADGGKHCGPSVECGTVFSITTGGVEKVLHSFPSPKTDGKQVMAGLVYVGGRLFGTTEYGGTTGYGTVFSITTAGAERVRYSFQYPSDGVEPEAGLLNVGGLLYGTAVRGGTHDDGSAFSVTTSGTEKVLYNFGSSSNDGEDPVAGLINVGGILYGTTSYASSPGYGTVFSVTKSGVEKTLHGFGNGTDGRTPYAGLIDVGGMLYGTTGQGGAYGYGTVFSITTSGTEKVLYSFAGGSDGSGPAAGLIGVGGLLYGTTASGGAYCVPPYNSCGTLFSITTGGAETVLHSFGSAGDGAIPTAGLLDVSGTLYGTTSLGGAHNNGTVFTLTP
ncbi:MAG: hypothetical protein JO113_01780 [Candidatus Eremiobacteraeota bacterium]|nr:hypothetical protein [Candidatus Eremiobacteraeota bacterium]